MGFTEVRQLSESWGVPEGNEDKAMVDERSHRAYIHALLATTQTSRTNKCSGVFARESSGGPKLACRIPEYLELSGPISVPRGYAEEERIVLREDVGSGDGVVGLGRGVHFDQDLLWESLSYLINIRLSTGAFDTSLFGFSKLGHMAVQGVNDNRDFRA